MNVHTLVIILVSATVSAVVVSVLLNWVIWKLAKRLDW